MRIRFPLLLVVIAALPLPGCASFWHDLQPHRIHRLNRGPAPSMDPEFSAVTPQRSFGIALGQSESAVVRAQH